MSLILYIVMTSFLQMVAILFTLWMSGGYTGKSKALILFNIVQFLKNILHVSHAH